MHTQTFITAEQRLLFYETPDGRQDRSEGNRENAERTKQQIHGELQKLQESLPKIESVQHREDGLVTSFRFQGRSIECPTYPLNKEQLEETLRNVQKTFQYLNKQTDVASLINEQTTFHLVNGLRMEFAVKKGGVDTAYVATPFEVLHVVDPKANFASEEDKRKISELRERSRLLFIKAGQERPKTEEEEKIRRTGKKMSKDEWIETMNRACQLESETREIEMRANGRLLHNDRTGTEVREYQSPASGFEGYFVQETTLPDGTTQRKVYRDGLEKVEFLRDGQMQNADIYDAKRLRAARHTYRDGKLEGTDHYAVRDGKEIVTYRTLHLPEPSVLFPVPQENQTVVFLNPFSAEMTATQTMQLFESIDTREKYDIFEEVYWEKFTSQLPEREQNVVDAVSRRGKELYGLTERIEELESNLRKHSINFRIKLEPNYETRRNGERAKLRDIAPTLAEIMDAIQKYPPQYLQNHKLQDVYVLGSLRIPNLENPAGYYDPNYGLMVLSPSNKVGIRTILHHEYDHGSDEIDGGLRDDNDDWIRQFHADGKLSDGENVYEEVMREEGEWRILKSDVGFARPYGRYSRSAIVPDCSEDQATIAEALFDEQTAKKLYEKAENDPVLHEKIAHRQRWYFIRSEGRMDARYFQDVVDGVTIDAAYWERRETAGDFDTDEIRKLEKYMQFERAMQPRREDIKELFDACFRSSEGQETQIKSNEKLIAIYNDAALRNPYNNSYVQGLDNALWRLSHLKENVQRAQRLTPILEARLALLPEIDRGPSEYARLAGAYAETSRAEEARALYEKAIEQFPRDYTLGREYVAFLRKTHPDDPSSDLVTTHLAHINERSGQRKDCDELIGAYSARGESEKLINVMQNFCGAHPENKDTREFYEKKMVEMGRRKEVISFYEEAIQKAPKQALVFSIALANFYADGVGDLEKACATLAAMMKRWPGNVDVQNAFMAFIGQRMKGATGEERGKLYREAAEALRTSWFSANDVKAAVDYTDFVLKYGSYGEAKEAYLMVREHFKNAFQGQRQLVTDKVLVKSFLENEINLKSLMKAKGTPEEHVQVCREFLEIAGEQPDLNEIEGYSAFSALVLYYENHDIDAAIALCGRFIDDKTLDEHRQRDIKRQYYYLLTCKEPGKWIKVPQSDVEYAFVEGENGIMYVRSGNSYIRRERWVAEGGRIDSFSWSDYSGSMKHIKKIDLPKVLKD